MTFPTWVTRINLKTGREQTVKRTRKNPANNSLCEPSKSFCRGVSSESREHSRELARKEYQAWKLKFEARVHQFTPFITKWAESKEKKMLGIDWFGLANRALWNAASTYNKEKENGFYFYLKLLLSREAMNAQKVYWNRERTLHKQSLDVDIDFYENFCGGLQIYGEYNHLERREEIQRLRDTLQLLTKDQEEAVFHFYADEGRVYTLQKKWGSSKYYPAACRDRGMQILREAYRETSA